jgi:hypothetical protein
MSSLSYMTNHYQHAINDHAKATKYIPPYRYKKSSLKSETTQKRKIPGKHFVLWAIKILKIR